MSGTRGGLGKIVAMGIALAVVVLLVLAGEARAGKYAVAQCGWYVGADAGWADTTGGAKFRSDAYCVPPAGVDPFDGAHLKSLTRDGQSTVSGTRFARWRWEAPGGTGITQVRGTWWHTLHDGMEQRIGAGNSGGGFDVFAAASTTDVTPREFVAGFASPVAALEDRLLCARPENKSCSLDPGSWSGLRALTITIDDPIAPQVGIGGSLLAGGWRRGVQDAVVWSADGGSGLRFGETTLDNNRVGFTEFSCAKASIGGEWRATQMRPCSTEVAASHSIATWNYSDGPHLAANCATDFAANTSCTTWHTVLIDNNPPVHPRSLALAGGEDWRRTDDFDLSWENPDQGPASPIGGASWRLTGPGFDTGVQFAGGRDRTSLVDLAMPTAGAYSLQLWLRDEAGNEAPSSALTVPLRFDDLRPGVAFATDQGAAVPERIRAEVNDPHSGPASGTIYYRRADSQIWLELPTKLLAGEVAGTASLVAPLPDLAPGTYQFRADALDAAGNSSTTTLRADGTEMAVRKVAPSVTPKAKTRLYARLGGAKGPGDRLTTPFSAAAIVVGRLAKADDVGIADHEVRVVSYPARGAAVRPAVQTALTGPDGSFRVELPKGPSRRIVADFAGDGGFENAGHSPLWLRVRSGLTLRAAPRALRTGQMLRLSGRVRGHGVPMPRRGKLVAIQYLERATHRWRPVLVVRSDHRGRFHARYRFRYVKGVASIRLRATALSQDRWPYMAASSRAVTVRVRG